MKHKLFFWTILLLISPLLLFQEKIEAATYIQNYDYEKCYNDPIPGGVSSPDWTKIKNDVLTRNNIKTSIVVGGETQPLNLEHLYKRHMVSYGGGMGELDLTKTHCGLKVYRYAGYTAEGRKLDDPVFRVDKGGSFNYIKKEELVRFPWNNSGVKTKATQYSSWFPYPTKDNLYKTNADRIEDLDNAIDTFSPNLNGGRGYFAVKNDHWCVNASGALYLVAKYDANGRITGNTCGSNGVILTGKYLQDFAVILTPSSEFSPGIFLLYIHDPSCNYYPYCYSSHVIPQQKDPFDKPKIEENDASVQLNITNKNILGDETLEGSITIQNNWNDFTPLSISSPCDSSGNIAKAQCRTAKNTGEIIVTYKGTKDEVVFKQNLTFNDLSVGKNTSIPLKNFKIPLKKSGTYKIDVSIPEYVNHKKEMETDYKNNIASDTFKVTLDNAFVQIDGNSSYVILDKLTNLIKVTNKTEKNISGNLMINILKEDKTLHQNVGTIPFNNIATSKDYTYDLSNSNIRLTPGTYYIHAKIPHYPNEITYDDNETYFKIEVNVFIPENTTCNKISTQYTNSIPHEGTDGITRSCIGWVPNYPSTRVEGGQGTFFYFAYKIFATPMPAYKVTTHDKYGLSQTYEMREPKDTLGSCDMKIANDTKCNLYQPFLYYPEKWESRFNTAPFKDFIGPYTAGSHSFYHYMYRGRMVPQSIDFNFKIVDMKGKSNFPLANGTISYDVPDECYLKNMIEIKEECRTIQFYVPVENITGRLKMPEDASSVGIPENKIIFLNPGEHTFQVDVQESQIYLYQMDKGAEWQGKSGFYREKWNGESITYPSGPVKTNTLKTLPHGEIQWVEQDEYKNHCYSTEDAFSDFGKWNQSTSDFQEIINNPAIVCFHDHSEDFHYWKFDWTDVKKFGTDGKTY